jgi:hypothetical protein
MKHHFVKTENYQSLLDGIAFMERHGSLTTPLCLLHGEPGVGKTCNVSKIGPDLPAVFIKGHVGMNLDGLIWSLSQGLGVKHVSTLEQIAYMRGLTRLCAADIAKHRLVVDHEESLVMKAVKPVKSPKDVK